MIIEVDLSILIWQKLVNLHPIDPQRIIELRCSLMRNCVHTNRVILYYIRLVSQCKPFYFYMYVVRRHTFVLIYLHIF